MIDDCPRNYTGKSFQNTSKKWIPIIQHEIPKKTAGKHSKINPSDNGEKPLWTFQRRSRRTPNRPSGGLYRGRRSLGSQQSSRTPGPSITPLTKINFEIKFDWAIIQIFSICLFWRWISNLEYWISVLTRIKNQNMLLTEFTPTWKTGHHRFFALSNYCSCDGEVIQRHHRVGESVRQSGRRSRNDNRVLWWSREPQPDLKHSKYLGNTLGNRIWQILIICKNVHPEYVDGGGGSFDICLFLNFFTTTSSKKTPAIL